MWSSRKTRVRVQQPNFFSSHSATTQQANLHTFLRKHCYDPRPQVSRQMPRVDLKWVGKCCLSIVKLGHAHPLSRLSVHHLLRDSRWKLSLKRNSFLPNPFCPFYREPIRLQHDPVKILNPFLLIPFQYCVSKSAEVLPLFLLFYRYF